MAVAQEAEATPADARQRRRLRIGWLVAIAVVAAGLVFAYRSMKRAVDRELLEAAYGPRPAEIESENFLFDGLRNWIGGFPPGTRVHCLGRFIDSAWVFELPRTDELAARLIAGAELTRIDVDSVPSDFFDMPAPWWPSRPSADAQIYRSESYDFDRRGADGDHYAVLDVPSAAKTYVCFKHNF